MAGFRSVLWGCGGLAVTTVTRGLMGTLDFRAAFYDPTVDPAHAEFQGPVIYLCWHEYIPFMFYLRGHSHTAALLSRHQDAELLYQACRLMGFQTVRGSTNRGGVAALRELIRKSRRRLNLAITPDGPRGPRRRLAQGPIFLSSRLQIPLVIAGLGYDRPWRMPTWDRFAVPRPFSRARLVISPRIQIPAELDRDGLEHYRRRMERLLAGLTADAEGWAAAGGGKLGQVTVRRQAAARRPRTTAPSPTGKGQPSPASQPPGWSRAA
ncbi:MAG: lysophospholipid acyltransferase family protein [Pirellulaceae bacterium]|nr:lysophospholipid acyltransferase family protein [Pirellulaceae bacterium]